jgi:hypothetical protein
MTIGYAPLSFFAKNRISAFVGPRSSAGYAVHGRRQSRLGILARNESKKSLTTGQARFPWAF